MIKKLQRFGIWYYANTTAGLYWRVKYVNGETTRLLPRSEAKGLVGVWGGKMYIDYDRFIKK